MDLKYLICHFVLFAQFFRNEHTKSEIQGSASDVVVVLLRIYFCAKCIQETEKNINFVTFHFCRRELRVSCYVAYMFVRYK